MTNTRVCVYRYMHMNRGAASAKTMLTHTHTHARTLYRSTHAANCNRLENEVVK